LPQLNRDTIFALTVAMTRASTPCIKVCLLDPETGLCEGCGRSREEIARWLRYTEDERLRIMAELPARMRRAFLGEGERA
jgi:predicted Fe-S protein YdhL (DUF1289 family)